MSASRPLSLVLTVEETNMVLDALGRIPYRDVHELVANIRAQAERQLAADPHGGTAPAREPLA